MTISFRFRFIGGLSKVIVFWVRLLQIIRYFLRTVMLVERRRSDVVLSEDEKVCFFVGTVYS